jgi:hypothetical protein
LGLGDVDVHEFYKAMDWLLALEQASPNEGKVQKHENLQLFPVFLE